MPSRPAHWIVPLAAALLLAGHAAMVLHQAWVQSATYDEPYYASAGWARWAGGQAGLNPEHPPAVKLWLGAWWLGTPLPHPASVPGFTAADQWTFAPHALYDRPALSRGLLFRARGAVLILSLLLGTGVLLTARRWFGDAAGLLALALYVLDPLVVANAGLATLDLPVAAAIFGSAALTAWALDGGGWPRRALAAAVTGLALASKGTALVTVPVVGLLALAPLLRRGGARPGEMRVRLSRSLVVLLGAVAVLALASLPGGGPSAWWRALELQRAHAAQGHATYLLGRYAMACWPWYFPVAWTLKTPLPILAAGLGGVLLVAARLRRAPEAAVLLLAPPALLVAGAVTSGICNGVRQLLPATPFLAVAGGAALASLAGRPLGRWLAGGALAWSALALLRVHPDAIAYSNELAGGPARTWERLTDSNVDWGQSLPELQATLRDVPVRRLWLEYFGTAWPPAHGLERYRRIRDPRFRAGQMLPEPRRDGLAPDGRELLAVSATCLVDVYVPDRDLHAWLRARTPWAWAGHSIAIYDITGDAEAYRRLAEMADRMGDRATAAEARARVEELTAPAGAP
jgi:hypothetical protein